MTVPGVDDTSPAIYLLHLYKDNYGYVLYATIRIFANSIRHSYIYHGMPGSVGER